MALSTSAVGKRYEPTLCAVGREKVREYAHATEGEGAWLRVDGYCFGFTLQEKGVHQRSEWEEQVARYRNVNRSSVFYRDCELPSGPYDGTRAAS